MMIIDDYAAASSKVDDVQCPADPKSVAKFLKNTPGLGKTQIGEYLSRGPVDRYPFHGMVLKSYVDTFDFSGPSSNFSIFDDKC